MSKTEEQEKKIDGLIAQKADLLKELDQQVEDWFKVIPGEIAHHSESRIRYELGNQAEKVQAMGPVLIKEFKDEYEAIKQGLGDAFQAILKDPNRSEFDHRTDQRAKGDSDFRIWYKSTMENGFVHNAVEKVLEPLNDCLISHGLFDASTPPMGDASYFYANGSDEDQKYQSTSREYQAVLRAIEIAESQKGAAKAVDLWDNV